MTAKSRLRKQHRRLEASASMKRYSFPKGLGVVHIEADSERHAKEMFQERYGYWPDHD